MAQTPVPPEVLQQLTPVLASLNSVDNNERSAAEAHLDEHWVNKQPDLLLLGLASFIAHNTDVQLRSYCSVLLRRLAFKEHEAEDVEKTHHCIWESIDERVRSGVKELLLFSLANETERSVRNKVCDTIAEVAYRDLSYNTKWEYLLKALFECTQSPNALLRESAYRILAQVPHYITDQNVDAVKNVFLAGLNDPESQEIRLEAMKAAAAFMMEIDDKQRKAMRDLMPQMLDPLSPLITAHDDQNLADSLVVLIELGDSHPSMFRNVIGNVLTVMVSLAKDKSFEDRTRQTALELLLCISEAAPGMCRKIPNFVPEIVPVAMEMMVDIDDDESWYTTDELDDDDNEENYVMGESTLDRLARTFGGKMIVPVCFQYIPTMLQSGEWQQRRAALMAISSIGEGSVDVMEPELGNIISMILPSVKDLHPRVRYAACNTLGQLSTDFAPFLQERFHEPVITSLLPVLHDQQPRVQSHAAAAMVNFCEEAEKSQIEPYLDNMLENLVALLKTNKTYVQEQAVTTIATVADSAEDRFIKYHSVIMPLILDILRQASNKEYRILRARAIECASLIALAVGKEAFAPFTNDFIQILGEIQQSVTEPDDVQITYLLAAWARMCRVMGDDFLPYLPTIMPPLLTSAKITPEFTMINDDEEDIESKYPAEEGWEFVGVHGQQIGIKTSILEEKNTALDMLVAYARDLGAGFVPYVPEVFRIALPLLKFYFHDGVRMAAATLIPILLHDVKLANVPNEELAAMWKTIHERFTKLMKIEEDDVTFSAQVYASYSECLQTLADRPGILQPDEVGEFIKATDDVLKKSLKRLSKYEKIKRTEDYEGVEDAEEILEAEGVEEDILSEIAGAFKTLLTLLGNDFLIPYFDSLVPTITEFATHPSEPAQHFCGYVFEGFLEVLGPQGVAKYSFLKRQ